MKDLTQDARRGSRIAVRVSATLATRSRKSLPVQVIDASTRGCRIDAECDLTPDEGVWLMLAGLPTIYSRVIWRQNTLAELEFCTPIAETDLDQAIRAAGQLTTADIEVLQEVTLRSSWLATAAAPDVTSHLQDLARGCTVSTITHKLRAAFG